MEIREFVRNLDTDKVYFVNFRGAGTWATIYNNRLIFADGSGNTVDRDIMLFDDDRVFIYDAEKAYCYANCNEDNQIYPVVNKMPELKDGMFVRCDFTDIGDDCYDGVIIKNCRYIVFPDGEYGCLDDVIEDNELLAIYDDYVYCFNLCEEERIIWRRN